VESFRGKEKEGGLKNYTVGEKRGRETSRCELRMGGSDHLSGCLRNVRGVESAHHEYLKPGGKKKEKGRPSGIWAKGWGGGGGRSIQD